MKIIHLTKNKASKVDDADFEMLNQFKWCACQKRDKWYAVRRSGRERVYIHRVLLNLKAGQIADHIDGNGLNNCRENLRPATPSQNSANSKKPITNTSGFKGVSRSGKKWSAQIQANKKTIKLGRFDDIKAAAEAYRVGSKVYFGAYAKV